MLNILKRPIGAPQIPESFVASDKMTSETSETEIHPRRSKTSHCLCIFACIVAAVLVSLLGGIAIGYFVDWPALFNNHPPCKNGKLSVLEALAFYDKDTNIWNSSTGNVELRDGFHTFILDCPNLDNKTKRGVQDAFTNFLEHLSMQNATEQETPKFKIWLLLNSFGSRSNSVSFCSDMAEVGAGRYPGVFEGVLSDWASLSHQTSLEVVRDRFEKEMDGAHARNIRYGLLLNSTQCSAISSLANASAADLPKFDEIFYVPELGTEQLVWNYNAVGLFPKSHFKVCKNVLREMSQVQES